MHERIPDRRPPFADRMLVGEPRTRAVLLVEDAACRAFSWSPEHLAAAFGQRSAGPGKSRRRLRMLDNAREVPGVGEVITIGNQRYVLEVGQ
jgi:hypothetical protein